jgi:two-component system response regulator MprA
MPARPRFRILIVEDDVRTARTLAQMLGEDGYDVELCFDGPTAIARLGREPPPDFLIVDYRLPHVDGMVVAMYARSVAPRIPVFIVSSYQEIVRDMPALKPPAVLIAKPLVYGELMRALAQAAAA